MKMKTKAALLVASAGLLVTASVMGTLAYLTANDTVTNTFTVGDVQIYLDEALVNEYGEPTGTAGVVKDNVSEAARVYTGNTYKLIPGHEYVKDPTVTVEKGSEPSYVRMLVTVENTAEMIAVFGAGTAGNTAFGDDMDLNSDAWTYQATTTDATAGTVTLEYRYVGTEGDTDYIVDARTADVVLEPLFNTFTVPGAATNEQIAKLDTLEIIVEAQAIQADGFDTADLAWAAFE